MEKRQYLLSKELRRQLFSLFSSWSGKHGVNFHHSRYKGGVSDTGGDLSELEYSSLLAMCSVLCCGPVFDSNILTEDGYIYPWLDDLLNDKDEKVGEIIIKIIHLFAL